MKNKRHISQNRETASVLMLVIVFISLLRPVSPIIADGLAHSFWSSQHHLSLHQSGIDHVDVQIKKLNETGTKEPGKATTSTFTIETSLIYFDPIAEINLYVTYITIAYSDILFKLFEHKITPEIQPPDSTYYVLPIYA